MNFCRMAGQNIEATIMDLFTYGTQPISTLIRWAILCMIKFPDIQTKCHEEVDRVTGCGRTPTFCDIKCLPYIQATLLEVHRRFTISRVIIILFKIYI